MKARRHPIGDDAGPIAKGGRWRGTREAERKQQVDAVGTPEVEVLADDGLEEVPALDRAIEYLSQADFELAEGQLVIVAGRAFVGGHRPREPLRPAVEEPLNVGGAERIADGLQRGRVGAGQEPVVEALKANAI